METTISRQPNNHSKEIESFGSAYFSIFKDEAMVREWVIKLRYYQPIWS